MVLFDTGNILVQFEEAGEIAGATSTTGIENAYGTDGTTYAFEHTGAGGWAGGLLRLSRQQPRLRADRRDLAGRGYAHGHHPDADNTTPVALAFDASLPETSQPGVYRAALHLATNDPLNGLQVVPVTMTVVAPATWGKVNGTVMGWNQCDVAAFEMAGAMVTVESRTAPTSGPSPRDVSGAYGMWLDEAHSPVTVTVRLDGYVEVSEVVGFSAGSSTDLLHELRIDLPCFAMDTYAIELTVTRGHTATESMMLSNLGAGALEISDVYGDGWMTPDMSSGTVAADDSHPMDVVFSAVGMALGEHVGELVILYNDPTTPMMTVPVTMTVVTPTVMVDVAATPPSTTGPGELITYTIVVSNTSNGPVDIELMNLIPARTTYVEGSVDGGLDYVEPTSGDDYVTWTGAVSPGAPMVFTFAVLVDADVTGGTIDDTVIVTTPDEVLTDTESLLVSFYRLFLPAVFGGTP